MKKTVEKKLLEKIGQGRDWHGKPLTDKQAAILSFIKAHAAKFGYPPTRQEIADSFGLWPNGVQQHLLLMQRKGVLRLVKASRGIELKPVT